MLFLIPFFAVITKLAFKKWGHNYYEHIVINAYILSFYTLFNIFLLYPLMLLLKGNTDHFTSFTSFSIFTIPFILIWFFKGFYPDKPMKSIMGRVAITIGLTMLGFIVSMIMVATGAFIYGSVLKH